MNEQLNLVGVTVPGLGLVQRAVLDRLQELGTLSTDEAGAIVHAHRGKHADEARCRWCGVDGRPILSSLVRRGLAEKGAEGLYQLPRSKPPGGPGEVIPF